MKKFLFIPLIILSFLRVTTIFSQTTGSFEIQFDYKNEKRSVSFFVPELYDHRSSYPIVIGMHPGGSTGKEMRDMLYPAFIQLNAILVCPDNYLIQDLDIISECISYCISQYNADTSRIILTGYSFGGNTATHYAYRYYDKIAGLIGIAPALYDYESLDFSKSCFISNVIIIGSEDDFIMEAEEVKNRIVNNKGDLLYIEKKGVGHIDPYFSNIEFINDWITGFNYICEKAGIEHHYIEDIPFQVYFNASSHSLAIHSLNTTDECIVITCYDPLGRLLFRKDTYRLMPRGNFVEIPIGAGMQGFLLFSIRRSNKTIQTIKVLVN